MAKQYTKEEILHRCSEAVQDIANFYKQDFLNYRGTTPEGELYTEIIAGYIIEHIEDFKTKIPMITRGSSYKVNTHKGEFDENSVRVEEITAMKMFNQCKTEELPQIGKIIDYQTPLNDKKDSRLGKIDLLADDGRRLIILELKKPDSGETMLRCVMEGFTYLKTVDKKKLLSDFGCPESYGLSASPFVFADSAQSREMQEERPNLKRLMELLESVPYYISEKNGKYSVSADAAAKDGQTQENTNTSAKTPEASKEQPKVLAQNVPQQVKKESFFVRHDFEKFWGGIFALIAIAAAILSTVFGDINASSIFGCIKDVFGTLVAVALLWAMFKKKRKGDFGGTFNNKMQQLSEKYDPLLSPPENLKLDESKEPIHIRYYLASNLDAIFTFNPGGMNRFLEFYRDKEGTNSKIIFWVQKSNFKEKEADRTKETAIHIFNALKSGFKDIADFSFQEHTKQITISVDFKEPLINANDAQKVTEMIDRAIFYYIAEYKK